MSGHVLTENKRENWSAVAREIRITSPAEYFSNNSCSTARMSGNPSAWRARKNGRVTLARISVKDDIYKPLVEQETLIEIRRISVVGRSSARRARERYTSRYKSRTPSRRGGFSLPVYRDCRKHTLRMVFSWRLNYPDAAPKNDLIAIEENLEGHYARPP